MQFFIEEPIKLKSLNKNRTSSTTFNSKKIKTILTSRQTCDQPIIGKVKQCQQPPTTSSKAINYHRKGKSYVGSFNGQSNLKKSQNRALLDLIKPMKYEKTKEESLLIKHCDKSKMIYWDKDLLLKGNQRYLILSADLVINQDCFWDKISSDNGNFINSNINAMGNLNHNSTNAYRNRNINVQSKSISTSNTLILNNQQSKKNPLLNPNRLNLLIRQWKNLHTKTDAENRKFIVLWMIRKQSTYAHLLEFVQLYQLPLHAIFYVKRKRTNSFFDLGLIVKQVHQKFFEAIVNIPETEQLSPQTLKSIQQNTQFNRSKSKQPKNNANTLLLQSPSIQIKRNFNSVTNKIIKSLKDTSLLQNDQNCSNALNLQTCKEFQLSKNNKKPLMSIVIEEKQAKKILRKFPPSSAGKVRPVTVKILQIAQKIQVSEKHSKSKHNISPLIKDDEKFESQGHSVNSIQQIRQQNLFNGKIKKYFKPEIYLFEGLKCNSKDYIDMMTFEGKIPLMLAYHEQRFEMLKNKLKQSKIEFQACQNQSVKTFYFKYESINDDMLQTINISVKELMGQNFGKDNVLKVPKINEYLNTIVQNIITEFKQFEKQQQMRPETSDKENQIFQLSQQQEEIIYENTQKKLQQIKKQLINDMIVSKGRNFTFQNGQSIYYFVGDVFKRNYNLLFNEHYKIFQRQMRSEMFDKHHLSKQHSSKGKRIQKTFNPVQLQVFDDKNVLPKLSEIQFYEFGHL